MILYAQLHLMQVHPRCRNQVYQCNKHKIDIFDYSIVNLNAREFFHHEHFRIFSSMMSRVPLLNPHRKLPLNSHNSSIENIHEKNYLDSAILSYSSQFEEQCFSYSFLKQVNNSCCYESIGKLLRYPNYLPFIFFKANNMKQTISEEIKF